jgi:hypothetical protein
VEIDTQKPPGPVPGDFSAAGAIEDSGTFALVDRHESSSAPNFVINHLKQTFVTENGTFTMRVQIKETGAVPGDPTVLNGSGRWVITSGTGAYEGIHGQGAVSGLADFENGVIDRTYTGNVHQTPSGAAG